MSQFLQVNLSIYIYVWMGGYMSSGFCFPGKLWLMPMVTIGTGRKYSESHRVKLCDWQVIKGKSDRPWEWFPASRTGPTGRRTPLSLEWGCQQKGAVLLSSGQLEKKAEIDFYVASWAPKSWWFFADPKATDFIIAAISDNNHLVEHWSESHSLTKPLTSF